jgi:hypothetical protein
MCHRCDEDAAVEDYTLSLLDLAKHLGIPPKLGARAMARAAGVLAAESGIPGLPVPDMQHARSAREHHADRGRN